MDPEPAPDFARDRVQWPPPATSMTADWPGLAVTERVATNVPPVCGAKRMSRLHVAPADSTMPGVQGFIPAGSTIVYAGAPEIDRATGPVVASPVLETVQRKTEAVPGAITPKSWVGGGAESCAGFCPSPERFATAEPPGLPVMVTMADRAPRAVGANRTRTAQLVPLARVVSPGRQSDPPGKTSWKCPASAPERERLSVPVEAAPVFVTTKLCSALVAPTSTPPKAWEVGKTVSAAGAMPVPESAPDVVPPGAALSSIAALRGPATVGVNRMRTVQLAPIVSIVDDVQSPVAGLTI